MRHFVSALIVCVTLVSSATADVFTVPGTHATPQAAVDAARPGDVVVLGAAGSITSLVIKGKGITVVSEDPAGPSQFRGITVKDLPEREVVVLRHLDVVTPVFQSLPGLTVTDCAGSVRIDDCSFRGSSGSPGYYDSTGVYASYDGLPGAHVVNSLDVSFTDTYFLGGVGGSLFDEKFEISATSGGDGLLIDDSSVVVHDCELRGADGGHVDDTIASGAGDGGEAVRVRSGFVHVEGSQLYGGEGGDGDCDFFAGSCGPGGRGGNGVRVPSGSEAVTRDNMYFPGAGGSGGDGTPAANGKDVLVDTGAHHQGLAPQFRHLRALTSPVSPGETLSVEVGALPGDTSVLLASMKPAHVPQPRHAGVQLVQRPITASLVAAVDADAQLDVIVPPLPVGVENATVFLQTVVQSAMHGHLWGPVTTVTVIADH